MDLENAEAVIAVVLISTLFPQLTLRPFSITELLGNPGKTVQTDHNYAPQPWTTVPLCTLVVARPVRMREFVTEWSSYPSRSHVHVDTAVACESRLVVRALLKGSALFKQGSQLMLMKSYPIFSAPPSMCFRSTGGTVTVLLRSSHQFSSTHASILGTAKAVPFSV